MIRPSKYVVVMLGVMLCAAGSARAVVVDLSARAMSRVVLFEDQVEDSSDESLEAFGPDVGVLPITTRAVLDGFDTADGAARGVAVADVADPTRTTSGRNPEELSLEANCFSNSATTSYVLASEVVERRRVRLGADELNSFAGERATVESAFFPSGALFVWSLDGNRDLTGLSAEVTFSVRRIALAEDGSDGESVELLNERVAVIGNSDGAIASESSNRIVTLSGDLSILPDIPGLPLGDLSNLESALVVIIPETQSLAYQYEAVVDEEFVLEATVSVSVSNLSGGTGVATVFGRPFDEAAGIIGMAIQQESARAIQARINLAMATFSDDTVLGSAAPAVSNLCGMVGFEMLAMLAVPFFWTSSPRRRGVPGVR